MSKKKDKGLLETAMESENPMTVALVLASSSHQQTMSVTRSLLDSYTQKIEELEKKVEEQHEYIYRVRERVERFFFGKDEPAYYEDLDHIYSELGALNKIQRRSK